MHVQKSFSLLFILLIAQCKSADIGQESKETAKTTPLILLMANDLLPTDLESLKSIEIESFKRISKSQNKWVIKVVEDEAIVLKLFKNLQKDRRVIEVSIVNKTQESSTTTTTNTKSGKSDSIRN